MKYFVVFMVTYFDVGVVMFVIPLLNQPLITNLLSHGSLNILIVLMENQMWGKTYFGDLKIGSDMGLEICYYMLSTIFYNISNIYNFSWLKMSRISYCFQQEC